MSSVLIASADARLDMSDEQRKAEVIWDKHDGIIGRIIVKKSADAVVWDSEGSDRRFGPDNAANVAKAMRWLGREAVKAYESRDAAWRERQS